MDKNWDKNLYCGESDKTGGIPFYAKSKSQARKMAKEMGLKCFGRVVDIETIEYPEKQSNVTVQ